MRAAFDPWPGSDYDPAIPTLEQVAGHDFGAAITPPDMLVRYLEALHQAAPERTRLVEYARSWEGRPLHYLILGSRTNMARLDEIRAGMQRLARPRGAARGELDRLVTGLPAIVWLAHGVHGDEVSSAGAALYTAYHLLAATGGEAEALLDDVLVVVDPAQNPDGRARFVQHYQSLQGLEPRPSPIAAERSQRWPTARTNHYLFDMNRDWFALTQPEVRGRVRAFLEYYPLVHVDLHEMGTDATYYFPPPAVPYNPYLSESQQAMLETLGQGMARAFDRFGFRYFSREVYDAYYPGYGDTWPALQGAAGMTFEMASARGLLGQRTDGSLVSYAGGVQRHFVASMATLQTAAAQRERLLREFLDHRRQGAGDTVFVLPRQGEDPGRVDKLARLLATQGVEVRRLEDGRRLCGETVPAGSYAVPADQGAGRLAATLLAGESPASAEFWQEQERRLAKGLPVEVYDVVAWSLPLLFGVPMLSCDASVAGLPLVPGDFTAPVAEPGPAEVAYLVPWGSQGAARFLAGALRQGLHVDTVTQAFSQEESQYPRGTLVLRRAANGAELPERVAALAQASQARVVAADSAWVTAGVGFGSGHVKRVAAPRIAMAWGEATTPYAAGAFRYVVEQKLGYPVTPVWGRDLDSYWLDQFDVLVLPDGEDYADVLGAVTADNLTHWVRRGGTLVAVGGAVTYLAEQAELLSVRQEWRALDSDEAQETLLERPQAKQAEVEEEREEKEEERDQGPVPGILIDSPETRTAATRPEQELPPPIPGVLTRARLDADHWLSAGLPDEIVFMLAGERIFTPLPRDLGTNVAEFAGVEDLVAGGYLWQSARAQLAHKPVVMVQPHERGQVIAFAADPTFRGIMDGLDVLVANALFLGPAMTTEVPAAPEGVLDLSW